MNSRACILAAGLAALAAWAVAPGDSLEEGFRDPPDSAKPRTWWYQTNSNVAKEGITKDLEWMKRVKDVAEVSANGKPMATVWKTPNSGGRNGCAASGREPDGGRGDR